jgi:RNA polymerase sigma factor (sigma-70 family)
VKSSRLPEDRPSLRAWPAQLSPEERLAREVALAQALLRGDREAGTALWDHFAPLVRGLLARALGPDEGLEDALQEIFLRVFHKSKTLRDESRLRSFVVAVSVHYIRSELRKRRLRRAIMLPLGRQTTPAFDTGTAAVAAPRLALAALYRALDELTVDERLAFTLRFFEGTRLEEGAALSGMSLATFKRRLGAAKLALWERARTDPWLSSYTEGALGFAATEEEEET